MLKLHLIEPTLFDQTGHGFSYTSSLVKANNNLFEIHVWLDKRGLDITKKLSCITHIYFYRKLRRIQKIFLYYKLFKTNNIIYICTAEFIDLVILTFLQKFILTKANIFLHFHQFNKQGKKLQLLQKIAKNNQTINIFTPTDRLTKIFQDSNFKNCQTVCCPSFIRNNNNIGQGKTFKKIIYAGAARKDKGFPKVINLLTFLENKKIKLPFEIQVSTPNSNRYDQETILAINKLEKLSKANIIIHKETLEQSEYQELFTNSICLLIYDNDNYNNKFSGVVLDAFYAGSPIITVSKTWMGTTVNRFKAGIVLNRTEPKDILQAINTTKQDYSQYSINANNAAKVLREEHDPQNTLLAIKNSIS